MESAENQNQVSRSLPTALGNRYAIPTFPPPATTVYLQNPTQRKETPQPVASLPPSGSFFDENMLFHSPQLTCYGRMPAFNYPQVWGKEGPTEIEWLGFVCR